MEKERNLDPRSNLYESSRNRIFVYIATAFLGGLVGFLFQKSLVSAITPEWVKQERTKIEKEIKQLELTVMDAETKNVAINELKSQLDKLDRAYPKIVWINNLFTNKYNKLLLLGIYGISLGFAVAPLLAVAWYFKKRIYPFAFPKPELDTPLSLGDFKELLNFSLAKIDRNTFKSLFHSDNDYEIFWRMINANIVKDDRAGFKAVADWVRQGLKEHNVSQVKSKSWNWKKDLKLFYSGSRILLGLDKSKFKASKIVRLRWRLQSNLKDFVDAYINFKENPIIFIAETFDSPIKFPPRLKARKGKIDNLIPFLLVKVGKFDTNLISKDIGKVLDELENWAEMNGIKIEDKKSFRARMGLALYVWLATMFVKEANIPAGLVNKFVKDYTAKYLISYLPSGLILKATNPYTAEARKYIFLYRTYRNPKEFAGLPIEDYLNLKYNLVFDV
jgi:hypothetical protein